MVDLLADDRILFRGGIQEARFKLKETGQSIFAVIKTENRNSKKGIISVDIADPEPERIIAAEHLKRIKKIVETVWGDVVIGKRHKGDLAVIHPIREVRMGDG